MKLCSLLFPKRNYTVMSPNFYTHIYLVNLYISRIGLSILLQPNMWTDPGNILNRSQTHECRKLGLRPRNSQKRNGIFVAVCSWHWRHFAAGIIDTDDKLAVGVAAIRVNFRKDLTTRDVDIGSVPNIFANFLKTRNGYCVNLRPGTRWFVKKTGSQKSSDTVSLRLMKKCVYWQKFILILDHLVATKGREKNCIILILQLILQSVHEAINNRNNQGEFRIHLNIRAISRNSHLIFETGKGLF